MENNITIARLYFNYGQSIKGQTFWKRLWNNSLSDFLLKKAKESNIDQATLFTAKAGYLNYEDIKNNISEIPPLKNPVCIELVDNDNKIKQFLELNKENLKEVKTIIINPNSQIILT
jgi:PII-like signaling protein